MFELISVARGRSQPAPAARLIPAGRLFRVDGTSRVSILVEHLEDPSAVPHRPITAARTALYLSSGTARSPRLRPLQVPGLSR